MRKMFFIVLFWAISSSIFAQKVVKGEVFEGAGNSPLEGVSVYWNNTTIGTITDSKGKFELPFDGRNHELVLSYVGFKTDTIHILEPTELKHWMVEDNSLEEVVLKNANKPVFDP